MYVYYVSTLALLSLTNKIRITVSVWRLQGIAESLCCKTFVLPQNQYNVKSNNLISFILSFKKQICIIILIWTCFFFARSISHCFFVIWKYFHTKLPITVLTSSIILFVKLSTICLNNEFNNWAAKRNNWMYEGRKISHR